MPLYEYECKSCNAVFELLRSRGDRDAEAKCPSCGSARCRRMMSVCAGRVSDGSGAGSSVAGSGGCGSCTATSCAGCRR
jgi:putative FmdB family regulatory protein